MVRRFIAAVVMAVALSGCPETIATRPSEGARIAEVPMYAGMDRNADPALKAGDEKFIAEVSGKFGGRENASRVWVAQGFQLYRRDQNGMAMRRFNQAWLLDPKNPEVFHGFSSVLYDSGNNCGAMRMAEHGLDLGLRTPDFLADAALLMSLCAGDRDRPPGSSSASLTQKADELFGEAASSPKKTPYVFDKWWQALYWRGDYVGAWKKVFEMRAAGGTPVEQFLRELRAKMPEPKQ
jgi:hypothetical protein